MAPRIVLASTSPQRRRLLEQAGFDFDVIPPAYEETPTGSGPEATVRERALGKARAVAAATPGRPVLGADTEVVLGDEVLGQPEDTAAAAAMLRRLAGREHRVLSAVAVIDEQGERVAVGAAVVRLRALDEAEIAAYVARGEWRGRAGGYAIQEQGGGLVASVDGALDTVIGLPVDLVRDLLERSPTGGNPAPA